MSKHIHRGSGTCGHNETLRPELRRTLHRLATAGTRTGVNMIFPGLVLFQPSPLLLLSTFLLSASLFSVGFRNSSLPEACSGKSKNSEFPGDWAGPHLKTCAHYIKPSLSLDICATRFALRAVQARPPGLWPIHDNTKTKVGKHSSYLCSTFFFGRAPQRSSGSPLLHSVCVAAREHFHDVGVWIVSFTQARCAPGNVTQSSYVSTSSLSRLT